MLAELPHPNGDGINTVNGKMINWQQIKQLEEDVGAEDLAEVVTLFLAEVDEAIEELDAVTQKGPSEIANALHFLKGSAFNLGFQRFGEFCSEREALAHSGETGSILSTEVEELYLASKEQFLANVSDHCSVQL